MDSIERAIYGDVLKHDLNKIIELNNKIFMLGATVVCGAVERENKRKLSSL